MDLRYLSDSEENRHVALSGFCAGTMYHVARLVKHCVPKHVVQCFQGSELESTLADVRITGSHAGRQQGLVERHGGSLRETWNKIVNECHIKGRASQDGAMCVQVQRATLMKCHVSRGSAVILAAPGSRPYFRISESHSWRGCVNFEIFFVRGSSGRRDSGEGFWSGW